MKKVLILGATGSVGTSACDICRMYPDHFIVTGLSAGSSAEKLLNLSNDFPQAKLHLSAENNYDQIDYSGEDALEIFIHENEADIVLNAISGAKGLLSSIFTLESGKDLALANKESMVMAGELIQNLCKKQSKTILPVDSEHSSLFNLMRNKTTDDISEIFITASGGPFIDKGIDEFKNITKAEALNHPTWNMGPKITIDSSTMANKGLEVIEAARLFNIDNNAIKVLVHRRSLVHGGIRLKDGSIHFHVSRPDMKLPVHNALFFPVSFPADFCSWDPFEESLIFEKPDMKKFPLLRMAYEALNEGNGKTIIYNAANEIAVDLFTNNQISYNQISEITERTLNLNFVNIDETRIGDIFYLDHIARKTALEEFLRLTQ